MSKGKKKRRNKPREMPPLSRIDRVIYGIIGVGMIAVLAAFAFWLCCGAPMKHWFGDGSVLACHVHSSRLWALPLLISLSITFLALWDSWYVGRRPIFGIKDFHYGPPLPRIYPLFGKDKPPKKPIDCKAARWLAALVLGVNLFLLAVSVLSLSGRDVLHLDGSIWNVNLFGQTAERYDASDGAEVILGAAGHSSGRGGHRSTWLVLEIMVIMDDGAQYRFEIGDFNRAVPRLENLEALEEVLKHYGNVTVEPDVDLERLIQDMELGAQEEAILWRLFEAEE